MKVYIVEEQYFCEGCEMIKPIKVFKSKDDAEKFVAELEAEFSMSYEVYEFEVE